MVLHMSASIFFFFDNEKAESGHPETAQRDATETRRQQQNFLLVNMNRHPATLGVLRELRKPCPRVLNPMHSFHQECKMTMLIFSVSRATPRHEPRRVCHL